MYGSGELIMLDNRFNRSGWFNPNLIVPGLPLYDNAGRSVAGVVGRFFSFVVEIGERLSRRIGAIRR